MSDKIKNDELTPEEKHFIDKMKSSDAALDGDTDLDSFIKSLPPEAIDKDGFYIPENDNR